MSDKPIDVDGIRNFVVWKFFTDPDKENQMDHVQWFIECLAPHFGEGPPDYEPVYHVREFIRNLNSCDKRAIYHLVTAASKWQPTERDVCFLCGAAPEMVA